MAEVVHPRDADAVPAVCLAAGGVPGPGPGKAARVLHCEPRRTGPGTWGSARAAVTGPRARPRVPGAGATGTEGR